MNEVQDEQITFLIKYITSAVFIPECSYPLLYESFITFVLFSPSLVGEP